MVVRRKRARKQSLPKGFKKGDRVQAKKHGRLPASEGVVVGGCFGTKEAVSVRFRGRDGRTRFGCVPTSKLQHVEKSGLGGIESNPWLEKKAFKGLVKKKVWPKKGKKKK